MYYIFSVLCALFLNTLLAPFFGLDFVVTVAFLPISIEIFFKIATREIHLEARKNIHALLVIFFGLCLIIFKLMIGQNYVKDSIVFLILPMLIAIYFDTIRRWKLETLRKLVLFFYLIECGVSFAEKILNTNFFFVEDKTVEQILYSNPEAWEFRSTALLGHPLANAMAIAVLMVFIILSNLKISKKIGFFLIGYLSLFCFNARGAIIISTFITLPYFFWRIYMKNKRYKGILILAFSLLLLLLFIGISQTSLGGRLLNNSEGLNDGSAMTRIQVFDFYKYIQSDKILYGNPQNYLYMTNKLGAGGVENGIITMVLNFGLIMTIPVLISLFLFQYNKLSTYSRNEKWLILTVFYTVGMMNPNLATPIQWIIFIFGYYSFRYIVPSCKKII